VDDDRVCRFVRLDAVALNNSRLEELIESAPAVSARISHTSHRITVTDPAEGETALLESVGSGRASSAQYPPLPDAMSYNPGLDRDKAGEEL
jgi:hypothetical protein